MDNLLPSAASSLRIVRVDEGRINERILAREAKVDYRRVEAASVKMPARFTSAEGKRLFVRMFATLQLNAHFISTLARTRLDQEDVVRVEGLLRERLDAASALLDKAIDGAEALFRVHGITRVATYDAQPLDIEVSVLSSAGRRYLELLGKLDQLMPMLQTLEIHEVITAREVDRQRAAVKRQVRGVGTAARTLASGLRKRMNSASSDQTREGGASAATGGPEVVPSAGGPPQVEAAVVPSDESEAGEPQGDGIAITLT
jgi:hypothetical protein